MSIHLLRGGGWSNILNLPGSQLGWARISPCTARNTAAVVHIESHSVGKVVCAMTQVSVTRWCVYYNDQAICSTYLNAHVVSISRMVQTLRLLRHVAFDVSSAAVFNLMSLTHYSEFEHYAPRLEIWLLRTIPLFTILTHCLIREPQILKAFSWRLSKKCPHQNSVYICYSSIRATRPCYFWLYPFLGFTAFTYQNRVFLKFPSFTYQFRIMNFVCFFPPIFSQSITTL